MFKASFLQSLLFVFTTFLSCLLFVLLYVNGLLSLSLDMQQTPLSSIVWFCITSTTEATSVTTSNSPCLKRTVK